MKITGILGTARSDQAYPRLTFRTIDGVDDPPHTSPINSRKQDGSRNWPLSASQPPRALTHIAMRSTGFGLIDEPLADPSVELEAGGGASPAESASASSLGEKRVYE